MTNAPHEVTRLLSQASRGDPGALNELLPYVYEELKRLAASCLRAERSDHTLQATALVHEAYLKLVDLTRIQWQDRRHFFVVAAMAMRRILVNHGKSRRRVKRGGGWQREALDEALVVGAAANPDIVDLDEALTRLSQISERRGRVVELRYFAGLGVEETAELLEVSPATVKQDWALAKAWLLREMSGGEVS